MASGVETSHKIYSIFLEKLPTPPPRTLSERSTEPRDMFDLRFL